MTETEKKILSELSAQQYLTQGWYKVGGVVYYFDGKELTSTNSKLFPYVICTDYQLEGFNLDQ